MVQCARMSCVCQGRIFVAVLVLALASTLGACGRTRVIGLHGRAAAHEQVPLPTTSSGVPFLLRTTVNDHGPYLFLLDTGSSTTVVSPRLVEETGLAVQPSQSAVFDAEGLEVSVAGRVRLGEMAMGGVSVSGIEAVVMDLDRLERTLGERVDGIVSGSVFEDLTLVIDFHAGQVWCTRARARPGDGSVVALMDRRLPMVRAQVAGQVMAVLIDSGSGGAWMLPTAGLATVRTGYQDRQVVLAGGVSSRTRERLDGQIVAGDIVFDEPMVEHTDGMARVGWRALKDYRVSIDRRSGVAVLERVGSERVDGPIRGIGARLVRVDGGWEVRSVEPGLPAAGAGLLDGERVLAVDGFRVDELDSAGLEALIQRAGRVRLDVLRAGGVEGVFVPVVYIEP
jgi:aspartyl protease